MEEEWRTVVYNGVIYDNYMVSNLGQVKRTYKNGNTKILKGRLNNKGYLTIDLCESGNKKAVLVHRLVAIAFVENPKPKEYTIVNHKDENPLNCKADNLEWCDYIYNNNYGTKLERRERTDNHNKKEVYQYDEEFNLIKIYPSVKSVINDGFQMVSVSLCCNFKSNRHRGFIWSFEPIITDEQKEMYNKPINKFIRASI